jgi:hypothetical protein
MNPKFDFYTHRNRLPTDAKIDAFVEKYPHLARQETEETQEENSFRKTDFDPPANLVNPRRFVPYNEPTHVTILCILIPSICISTYASAFIEACLFGIRFVDLLLLFVNPGYLQY